MRLVRPFVGPSLTAIALAGLSAAHAFAAPAPGLTLTLRDHRFTPSVVSVPAGQKIQVLVINQDAATEEFDSHDLKVEKLITPRARATFWIGPLRPGAFTFIGEFHPATAQGRIVAVEPGR